MANKMSAVESIARVMAMPGAPWAAMGDAEVRLLNAIGRLDSWCALNAAQHPSMWPIDTTDPAVETVLRLAVGGHADVIYDSSGRCDIEWWPSIDDRCNDLYGARVVAADGESPAEAWCALVERLGGWPAKEAKND